MERRNAQKYHSRRIGGVNAAHKDQDALRHFAANCHFCSRFRELRTQESIARAKQQAAGFRDFSAVSAFGCRMRILVY